MTMVESVVISDYSGVPRGVVLGVQSPPRNSEDIGGVLDRMSKKNRRLDFVL